MIKVFLTGRAGELFQLNMSLAPTISDELVLNDEPNLITSRHFVIEDTERDTKNVDYKILFVRKACSKIL